MQVNSMHFVPRTAERLADVRLQATLKKVGRGFANKRAAVMPEIDFEATREAAKQKRDHALENLDIWLELFEQKASAQGTTVLYAANADEANALVVGIAQAHQVKLAVKSKSMVSEETALNDALAKAGIQAVETDLGEYIVQIDNDHPSHIVAPIIHKSQEEIEELFMRVHGTPRQSDPVALTREARERLRPYFLQADMGISGGNFLIAQSGSTVIVTNEGNGRFCTTLPRVHVTMTGIEKVLPTLTDLATIMRLLPRSATGQSISNYVSLLTGVRKEGEQDGPEHHYIVLVDAGRSRLLGGPFQEMLRCIRCGACMNHCPVYAKIGGHSYGWVYPGPMGAVLTPSYVGVENALDLPHAATLCGQCEVVCPVKIPLPDLMRRLRQEQWERGLRPRGERWALQAWAYLVRHPRLYALVAQASAWGLRTLALTNERWKRIHRQILKRLGKYSADMEGEDDTIRAPSKYLYFHRFPGLAGWTDYRDFPVPSGNTFRTRYQRQQAAKKNNSPSV